MVVMVKVARGWVVVTVVAGGEVKVERDLTKEGNINGQIYPQCPTRDLVP